MAQCHTVDTRRPVLRFLAQFNMRSSISCCGAGAAAALGHFVDAGDPCRCHSENAIVGFLQEGKAEDALAAIRNMIAPLKNVLRDGIGSVFRLADLVPGDVVVIEAGDPRSNRAEVR